MPSCLRKPRAAADAAFPITLVALHPGSKTLTRTELRQPVPLQQDITAISNPQTTRQPRTSGENLGARIPLRPAPNGGDRSHLTRRTERVEEGMFDDDHTHLFVCMFSLPRTHSCYSFSLAAGLARIPSPCPPRKPRMGSRWAFAAVPRPEGAPSPPASPHLRAGGWQHRPPSSPPPMLPSRGCRD